MTCKYCNETPVEHYGGTCSRRELVAVKVRREQAREEEMKIQELRKRYELFMDKAVEAGFSHDQAYFLWHKLEEKLIVK